ncbi:golgin subfamily A member 6-like protein 25 [Paramacrobiotus metropolitanus]|uniref:golgin subfamily A member 6-like protein 25 n=1 Tax=Paramacrobiotus metropolitanus TaxID=2943436 RepID=UPI002445A7C1|nr:golgin subfamily A member 6-like protein 25 [Paramacrobiotus metropolitanus]XP_055351120.1 golgin subfamily A member 6-like protein 25 [Paramacrobiotus metropolitanus]XP_055351121.1 golgin subfamily A member 6-like protein 25 [Paramacrobiotus metropolitanus]
MDELTFDRRILIANLRADVETLDKILRRLLTSQAPSLSLPVSKFRSWKYPGSAALDVDVTTLLQCFGHPRPTCTAAELERSHTVLLELAVDRVAMIMAMAIAVFRRCSGTPDQKNAVRTASLASLGKHYVTSFREMLAAWGVGRAPVEKIAADSQTEFSYDPHENCENCRKLTEVKGSVHRLVAENFGREMADLLGDLPSGMFTEKLHHLIAQQLEKRASAERVNEDLNSHLTELHCLVNVEEIKKEELQRQLGDLRQRKEQNNAEIHRIQAEISGWREEQEKLVGEQKFEQQQAESLSEEIQNVVAQSEKVQVHEQTLVQKISAQEELRATEQRRWRAVIDEQKKLVEIKQNEVATIRKEFDPQWKEKLQQAQEDFNEITQLVENAKSMYYRNIQRIKTLKEELAATNS